MKKQYRKPVVKQHGRLKDISAMPRIVSRFT